MPRMATDARQLMRRYGPMSPIQIACIMLQVGYLLRRTTVVRGPKLLGRHYPQVLHNRHPDFPSPLALVLRRHNVTVT